MSKRKYKAPGKSSRKGIGVMELLEMFPDEESARKWFEDQRWSNGDIARIAGEPEPPKRNIKCLTTVRIVASISV